MQLNIFVQADQGGDVMELKTVLLALQKQQNQVQSRQRGRIKKGCSSGSEILSNGGNSVAKDLLEEANVDGSAHSSSDQVENDVLNGNGLNTGDSTQAEKANIPPKRQRENETKSNSRKKNRPPLVELPRRISRSRGCKETKVSHVDLTSDDDFQ